MEVLKVQRDNCFSIFGQEKFLQSFFMLNTNGWHSLWCFNSFFLQYRYSNYINLHQYQQYFTYLKSKLPVFLLNLFDQNKSSETYSASTKVALLASFLHFFVCFGFDLVFCLFVCLFHSMKETIKLC